MIRIGVTSYYEEKEGQFHTSIPSDYLNALIEQATVPIIIPVTSNSELIERYLDNVDGILLAGGEDIDPELYNERNEGLSLDVCRERDIAEMHIIDMAIKTGMPLLGICRGFQILNVFFGGTLYQDIAAQYGDSMIHSRESFSGDELHHEVSIDRTSRLGEIFSTSRTHVNSRHHQGIRTLGKFLNVSAKADDEIIEAFEHMEKNIMAVQWHPENITVSSKGCKGLFYDLTKRADNFRNRVLNQKVNS